MYGLYGALIDEGLHNVKTGQAYQIRIKGLVQGVGFRPTVWRIAKECGLVGEVLNDGKGVLIHAFGIEQAIDEFLSSLKNEAPPLSRIDDIECKNSDMLTNKSDFVIGRSEKSTITTGIISDAATCPECVAEIFDPLNRRHGYAFTNCTHCGPRLSITRSIPYDRINTSMSDFKMCQLCQHEYENPADRRFHAQPNACGECGPQIWLSDETGNDVTPPKGADIIKFTANLIKQGHIIAIKGIGGFHLACDATNQTVVSALRQRKKRYDKPFALMGRDIAMISKYVLVDDQCKEFLTSSKAPILLLQRRCDVDLLAAELAPEQNNLGFMLPYTPLHHLLMSYLDVPIVLTSANVFDEPQVIDNDDALSKLVGIADYWLMHDRDIVNRLDDSVLQIVGGDPQILRRARGYAPEPLLLPKSFRNSPNILAMGAELKNTFCILKNGQAIVSQHMGDLQKTSVHEDYRKNLILYRQAYDFTPDCIAVDRHPRYFSTQWGEKLSEEEGCDLEYIQHHHAHIAACLAEHHVELEDAPVIGIALDGIGYGEEGTLWGGEFLQADYCNYERLRSFEAVAMPGGSKASYEPWRNSIAHLHSAFGWEDVEAKYSDLEIIKFLKTKPVSQIVTMIERKLNAPKVSSTGRLFDAVAAVLGICRETVSFEGQAAMQLQSIAETQMAEDGIYSYGFEETIKWKPLWEDILQDIRSGSDKASIAARFHNTLAHIIYLTAVQLANENDIDTIVLSGGVFQNKLLLEKVLHYFKTSKLKLLMPQVFPANDGGISLGQAIISAARLMHN